jgi:hypothetical protein
MVTVFAGFALLCLVCFCLLLDSLLKERERARATRLCVLCLVCAFLSQAKQSALVELEVLQVLQLGGCSKEQSKAKTKATQAQHTKATQNFLLSLSL